MSMYYFKIILFAALALAFYIICFGEVFSLKIKPQYELACVRSGLSAVPPALVFGPYLRSCALHKDRNGATNILDLCKGTRFVQR